MSKFYKNITTILIILVIVIIIAASFSVNAKAIVGYDRFDSVTYISNSNYNYGFTTDPNTISSPAGFINPFIYGNYIMNGNPTNIPATTIQYDSYVWFKVTDNPNMDPYTYATLATSNLSYTGYYNTISIDLKIPCAGNYLDLVKEAPFWISYGQNLSIEPDSRTSFVSGPYVPSNMMGAPVASAEFYLVSYTLFYEEPIYVDSSTILSLNIPIAPFNFTNTVTTAVGVVIGLNDIEIDYYNTFEEAQNAKVIDLLTNSPNGIFYDEILGKITDQVADALASIEIEDLFYGEANNAIPDQLDSSAQVFVDDLWDSMGFIWHPWLVKVILTIIPIAVLSYALYGKAG